jgi:hypothetical protein
LAAATVAAAAAAAPQRYITEQLAVAASCWVSFTWLGIHWHKCAGCIHEGLGLLSYMMHCLKPVTLMLRHLHWGLALCFERRLQFEEARDEDRETFVTAEGLVQEVEEEDAKVGSVTKITHIMSSAACFP